jgi:hypothetical protein
MFVRNFSCEYYVLPFRFITHIHNRIVNLYTHDIIVPFSNASLHVFLHSGSLNGVINETVVVCFVF